LRTWSAGRLLNSKCMMGNSNVAFKIRYAVSAVGLTEVVTKTGEVLIAVTAMLFLVPGHRCKMQLLFENNRFLVVQEEKNNFSGGNVGLKKLIDDDTITFV